jgi:DNA-directed RNA polymerase subunit beta
MPNHRYFISDFVEIQRKSFFDLLEMGIVEEFSKRNPISDVNKNLELFFYPEYYKLSKPEYTVRQAILKSRSYASKFYIPVQLTDKKHKVIKLKWVLLGNLPLMTKRGHFLINGAARVIVNQIIRSPGIYFQQKIHEVYVDKWTEKPIETHKRYYADLICLRGTWLRIEIDKDKLIWAQMKKGPKIPVLWLLTLYFKISYRCESFNY